MNGFLKDIIDKLLIGTLAAIVSLVVLQNYNLYLHAFEDARARTRALSDLATANKNEIVQSVTNIVKLANDVVYRVDSKIASAPSRDAKMRQEIATIDADGFMLGSSFPDATKCVQELSATLSAKIQGNPDIDSMLYDKTLLDIADKQENFVRTFNRELTMLLSKEYKTNYEAFYAGASWDSDPREILFVCLAATFFLALISIAYSIFLAYHAKQQKPGSSRVEG